MGIIKKYFLLVGVINILCFSNIFLVEIQDLEKQFSALEKKFSGFDARLNDNGEKIIEFITSMNRLSTLVTEHAGLIKQNLEKSTQTRKQAKQALRIATEAEKSTEEIRELQNQFIELEKHAELKLKEEYKRMKKDLSEEDMSKIAEIEIAKIEEMEKQGVYDKQAKAMAEASVEATSVKWDKIKNILTSPELVFTTSVTATLVYLAKHGIPFLINRLSQPKVVIETSNKNKPDMSITDLIFSPDLQKQLFDLALRIKSAKTYDENLPNMLFYGAPGTGKSAFVRALAKDSGLKYAFTSGTEFAKIQDLNIANNELRKLLNWAKNDKKGSIIFIDEAESLFSNRKLSETSKTAQDFINTFLALVPEKSNKKLMFIFATNHPFKLDDAIIDRIGPKIEFVLPEARERNMILSFYLQRFADENKNTKVDIHSDVKEKLPMYSESLGGFSPRSIKFVAEEMIINARRQECKLLTHEIAQSVLNQATKNLQQEDLWRSERDEWVAARRV